MLKLKLLDLKEKRDSKRKELLKKSEESRLHNRSNLKKLRDKEELKSTASYKSRKLRNGELSKKNSELKLNIAWKFKESREKNVLKSTELTKIE